MPVVVVFYSGRNLTHDSGLVNVGRPPSTPADTELRRLIREGFDFGIPGEKHAEAAELSVRASIRSATGDAKPSLATVWTHSDGNARISV